MNLDVNDANASLIRALLFWGGVLFFLVIEPLVPYRLSSVSKFKRWVNNIALTAFNSIILQLVFAGAVVRTAMYVTTHQLGLLNVGAYQKPDKLNFHHLLAMPFTQPIR